MSKEKNQTGLGQCLGLLTTLDSGLDTLVAACIRRRRAAFAIGIKAYGTLSIIARAAKQGKVESFQESVEALKAAGLYLKGNVIEIVQKGIHKNRV